MAQKNVFVVLMEVRSKIGHALGRPMIVLETVAHSSYCYFAFAEGHGLYSAAAGVLLVVVIVEAVIGDNHA